MKQFIKTYWKTILFFVLAGVVGGFFTGLYILDTYPEELRQMILDQGLNNVLLGVVSAVQSAGYMLVLAPVGIFLGKKTGLWRDERTMEQKPLRLALVVALIGGLGIILPDLWFFGKYEPVLLSFYEAKPTVDFMLASVIYGGICEEVMLRLFFLTLLAWLLHKLFGKGRELPSAGVLVVANVIAALLFAAGHLPTTFLTIGSSPMILFRCFLLNGGFGLLFGWLYYKHGLRYAMVAHAGSHMVSKLIWILFI